MCICKHRCPGADWYRPRLEQIEWFRDRKGCHMVTLLVLDILLILLYTLISLIITTIIYLICVGVGYVFVWLNTRSESRSPYAGEIWGLGFMYGLMTIFFGSAIIGGLYVLCCCVCRPAIADERFLVVSGTRKPYKECHDDESNDVSLSCSESV